MTVSSSQPGGGRIYLRGGSLGIYTGDAWERLEAETGAVPSLYPAQTAEEGQRAVLTIRDISFQGTYYYPYRLTDGWGTTDESGRLTMSGGPGCGLRWLPEAPAQDWPPAPPAPPPRRFPAPRVRASHHARRGGGTVLLLGAL